MARKRDDPKKPRKTPDIRECNLDGEFVSPIHSFKDYNVGNIKSALVNSRYAQLLLSLTVAGLFLRFFNLGFNSIWLDEATTYNAALKTFFGIWQTMAAGDFNPPLFYWIEHIMLMLGNNEIILRFVPALFGILTIPVMYCVGKEFLDRNVGVIAAAATVFSPFLILYSQEARAYSMALFFIAFAMVFYLRALKDNSIKNWALFGILSAFAFWSHFYVFVLIASLVIYALALQAQNTKENLKKISTIILAVVVFSLASLPLIIVTIQLFFTRTAAAPTFGVQGINIIYQVLVLISGASDILLLLFGALFMAGIVHAYLTDKKQALLILSVLVLTFVITYIMSYKMPMEPRHLIFVIVPFYLGVASSYGMFYRFWNNRGIVYLLLALLIVVNLPMLATYYSGYSKDDWRGFSGQISNLTQQGDKIVLLPGYISQPFDYYYSNRTDGTIEYQATTVKDLRSISSERDNSTMFFIVTNDILAVNPNGDEVAWLQNQTKYAGSDGGIVLFVER
jgi:4-amino-4-deoxy-L-arabinose transferase-like glycosyltransferase